MDVISTRLQGTSALSTRSSNLSSKATRQQTIAKAVSKFAFLRSAAAPPEVLATYTQAIDEEEDLDTADIEAALPIAGKRERKDGEKDLPEVGWLIRVIAEYRNERVRLAKGNTVLRDLDERKAYLEAHPEEREMDAAAIAECARLNKKFGLAKTEKLLIKPLEKMCCPHCFEMLPIFGNLREMTPAEIHAYADALIEARRLRNSETESLEPKESEIHS